MIHICFLSSMHPLRDKRVFDKEAVFLAAAGFRVTHLAPGDGQRTVEKSVELVPYRRPLGLMGRVLQMPRLYRLARKVNADIYHCNEVDSWVIGAALRVFRGKRIVFDVHEVYPQEFAESRFPGWARGAVIASVRAVFRLLTPVTERIVLAKQSVAPDFNRWKNKQVLVQNFTPLQYLRQQQAAAGDSAATERLAPALTAVHLGTVSKVKGWPQLVDAVTHAAAHGTDVHVDIIGAFDGSYPEFRESIARRDVGQRFTYTEWLPFEQALQRLVKCDVGLVLIQPGLYNHTHALPHKMFDYMLAGLPVIAPAFAVEVARIVRDADCGVLVDSTNPKDISSALMRLAGDSAERRRLGENGRRAVLERYNWEQESARLIEMYRELTGASSH